MSQPLIYEASVYTRTVKYTNFKGETNEVTLYFALDPMQLMQVIASFKPKASKRSGNPARRAEEAISDEEQVKFVRDLASRAAGFPSEDGEVWEPFPDFADSLAGKAFMTKLASSDGDRKEFSEKVILDPFRAFVGYAEADPTNSQSEITQFKTMLAQLERVFAEPDNKDETVDERRARLEQELQALSGPAEGTQGDNGI